MTWVRLQWDRAGAIFALALGALSLFLGWLGVTDTPHVAKQLPYIASGGLFGIFLVGVAAALWISADLRDEWRELRGLREELRAAYSASVTEATATLSVVDDTPRLAAAPRASVRRPSVAMTATVEDTVVTTASRKRAASSPKPRSRS
jgi:peptidoglycan/LPS O-acetylase OafA/YrhL